MISATNRTTGGMEANGKNGELGRLLWYLSSSRS